jgi:hypothetical protein
VCFTIPFCKKDATEGMALYGILTNIVTYHILYRAVNSVREGGYFG